MGSQADSSIMSVAELIDTAFGDPDANVVHHKLIHTILYLLARQLRVLQRRVVVSLGPLHLQPSLSSLSVTEVKVHAKKEGEKAEVGTKAAKSARKTAFDTKSDKTSISDKTSSDKTSSDKTGSKSTSDKTASKSTSDKTDSKSSSDKNSSKSTSDKTTTRSTVEQTTTSTEDKTNSESTTDKTTKYSTNETLSNKSIPEKITTGTSGPNKTLSSKSTPDKTTIKSTTDQVTSSITTPDKTTTSKSTTDKVTSSKSTRDKTSTSKSTTDQVTSSKSTADKSSSRVPSSKDKSSSDRTSPKASSSDRVSTDSSSRRSPQDYLKILDKIEEQREREIRIIHQRADSREEHEKFPTPMKSMDSMETRYEKLLVVERVPAEEAKARAARELSGTQKKSTTPQLSVVTQEQFDELAAIVRQIEYKFAKTGMPDFPENAELMAELRKGASLTDAMAALQLSARLEATEKMLQQMMSLVTDLISQTPGIDLDDTMGDEMEVIYGGKSATPPTPKITPKTAVTTKKSKLKQSKASVGQSVSDTSVTTMQPQSTAQVDTASLPAEPVTGEKQEKKDKVSYEELESALNELYDGIMKVVNSATSRSNANAENALKIANRMEGKIDASLKLGNRMDDLELVVSNYAEKINILDTGLSSQMTDYQEELTQMQHDLETGLETMADVLANTGGDATAVAELNTRFNDFQADIDAAVLGQSELREIQTNLSMDLNALKKHIEILRDTKSDREEVADALRDKAGLGALNGMVSLQQFDAVRGDFEKRIGSAYDKFNNQELTWQKAIDDLTRELNEKVDIVQLDFLRNEIDHYLNEMREKLKFMMDIVGEPKAAALSKQLHRDTACLSCATAAHMSLESPNTIPELPGLRPPVIGAENKQPKEDGDHGLCYPGLPIPHPIDPRAHLCRRWCGGSHTKIPQTVSRVPPSMLITPQLRKITQEIGTDGKMYAVDELQPTRPCTACRIAQTTSIPSENHNAKLEPHEDNISGMTPPDFRQTFVSTLPSSDIDIMSKTPPLELN